MENKRSPATSSELSQCCGSCKWFDVPAKDLRKDGNVKEIRKYMAYHCTVPFEKPKMPASVKVEWRDDPKYRLMCSYYGSECAFYEHR